jgi:hypothetical protein
MRTVLAEEGRGGNPAGNPPPGKGGTGLDGENRHVGVWRSRSTGVRRGSGLAAWIAADNRQD